MSFLGPLFGRLLACCYMYQIPVTSWVRFPRRAERIPMVELLPIVVIRQVPEVVRQDAHIFCLANNKNWGPKYGKLDPVLTISIGN